VGSSVLGLQGMTYLGASWAELLCTLAIGIITNFIFLVTRSRIEHEVFSATIALVSMEATSMYPMFGRNNYDLWVVKMITVLKC
jgi:hypothetical protein